MFIKQKLNAFLPLLTGSAIISLIAIWYTLSVGVNVPYLDDWYYAPMLDHWFHGQLKIEELFASYSHVRMALASVIQIALASLTNWNLKASFLFIDLVAVLMAIFVQWAIKKNGPMKSFTPLWFLACISPFALFLSLRNWENFLLGMQINMSLGILLSLVSLYALTRLSKFSFLIAIISSVGGAFSYTNALLVLPLGILIMAMQKNWKRLTVWVIFSSILLILYVTNGWGGSGQMSITGRNILSISEYFILMAGSPIALAHSIISSDGKPFTQNDLIVSTFLGMVVIIGSLYALWRFVCLPKRPLNIFFVSMILWGLGSMAFITLAREQAFGVKQALAPRYAWFVSVLICGDIGLLVSEHIWKQKFARFITVSFLVLISISYLSSFVSETRTGPFRHTYLENWASTVKNYRSLPDDQVKDVLKDSTSMREAIGLIEKNHLSVFAK